MTDITKDKKVVITNLPPHDIVKLSEEEMVNQSLITSQDVTSVIVKHAYCQECGEELISDVPPMINPYTLEHICRVKCNKCGKLYNLEYAYPRLVLLDNNGNEIPAFGR